MLGSYERVGKMVTFLSGVGENLLALIGQGQIDRSRELGFSRTVSLHLFANCCHGGVRPWEKFVETFTLPQKS
jgi:hypothetical protein